MLEGGGGGGYSGHQIYQLMHAPGTFTDSLAEANSAADLLHRLHDEIANELASIHVSMNDSWKGQDAEAAKARMELFRKSSEEASVNLEPSRTSTEHQNSVFWDSRNELKPMPARPEKADPFWPWDDDQDDKNAAWNELDAHNRQVYTNYWTASTTNSNQIVGEYRPVEEVGSDGGGDTRRGPAESTSRSAATPNVGGTGGGFSGGGVGSGYHGPTGTSSTPHVNAPAASYTSPTSPSGVPGVGQYGGTGAGGTAPSGYGTGAGGFGPGAGGLGSTGYGVGGFGASNRGSRSGSGTDFGPGGGAAFGPIGSGGGAGGAGGYGSGAGGAGQGQGQGMGAGRAAGVGMPGAGAGGGPGGAAAGGAMGGRGGMGGGGMMGGAGAGRGQGGEDKDHQRRYGLDSDDWFKPERDEDGGILRDPVTGMPVVPPVIGE